MAKRERIEVKNDYFVGPKAHQFVSTGCTLLDCALGGGFPLGRVVNVVGDKSTAKTGLATEVITNFIKRYPEGVAAYRDAEAAFDEQYAAAMGMPTDRVDFGDRLATVEDLYRDLEAFLDERLKTKTVGVYVVDSLDSLSDEAALDRDVSKGSFGAEKAKKISKLFADLNQKIEASSTLFVVISQVRDNIGAMFGDKHTRSGGRALDFYATHIVWLAHTGFLKRTIRKVERIYGFKVKAKVKKNKVGLAMREAEFEYHFAYGIEDVLCSVEWLNKVGHPVELDTSDMTNEEYRAAQDDLATKVRQIWGEIETSFLPKRQKYGG